MTYDQQTGNVVLTINQIGPGDEGEYTCSARNQYGEAICSVFIQPEGTFSLKNVQIVLHRTNYLRIETRQVTLFNYRKARMAPRGCSKHKTRCTQTTIRTLTK